ncbi:MAG: hypothetical protein AAGA47_03520 [Pseudomonadota bacterium]
MTAYNRTFELGLEDLELIEASLYRRKAELAAKRLEALREDVVPVQLDAEIREIAGLLGRLHNQKQFYRPKQGVYVSG